MIALKLCRNNFLDTLPSFITTNKKKKLNSWEQEVNTYQRSRWCNFKEGKITFFCWSEHQVEKLMIRFSLLPVAYRKPINFQFHKTYRLCLRDHLLSGRKYLHISTFPTPLHFIIIYCLTVLFNKKKLFDDDFLSLFSYCYKFNTEMHLKCTVKEKES